MAPGITVIEVIVAWCKLIWLQNAFMTVKALTNAWVSNSSIGQLLEIMLPFPKSVARQSNWRFTQGSYRNTSGAKASCRSFVQTYPIRILDNVDKIEKDLEGLAMAYHWSRSQWWAYSCWCKDLRNRPIEISYICKRSRSCPLSCENQWSPSHFLT